MSRTLRMSTRGLDLSQTGRHRAGMPILWSRPPPTPAASHLNPSATSIPHYLPSPPPTDWTVCSSHDRAHHLHLLPVTSTPLPPQSPTTCHLHPQSIEHSTCLTHSWMPINHRTPRAYSHFRKPCFFAPWQVQNSINSKKLFSTHIPHIPSLHTLITIFYNAF